MDIIYSLQNNAHAEALGWTLFHSLWQAALLVSVLILLLIFTKGFTSRIRFLLAYSTMIVTVAWSVYTYTSNYNYIVKRNALKEQVLNKSNASIEHQIAHLLDNSNKQSENKISNAQVKWINLKAKLSPQLPIALLIWVFGVLLLLLRLTGSLAQLLRLTQVNKQAFNPFWEARLKQLAKKLNIKQEVNGYLSYKATVPMVIGQLKPIILIPASLMSGLSTEQLEAIIAHELAHIKRHDYVLNLILSYAETFFFFNPAIWLMAKIIRDEREYSCDELAVALTKDKINYIKALASAQEFSNKHYKAVAFSKRSGSLLSRINYLKTIHQMKSKLSAGFYAASIVVISVLFLSFTTVKQQEPQEADEYLHSVNKQSPQNQESSNKIRHEWINSRDTVIKKVKEIEELPEDFHAVMELALLENNDSLAAEMMKGLEKALDAIDMEAIQEISLKEAEMALENLNLDSTISAAMEAINIDSTIGIAMEEAKIEMERAQVEMKLAMKEMDLAKIEMENLELNHEELSRISQAAVEQAIETMNAMNMDSIISVSLNESIKIIENIEIDQIVSKALQDMEEQEMDSAAKEERLKQMEEELQELEQKK